MVDTALPFLIGLGVANAGNAIDPLTLNMSDLKDFDSLDFNLPDQLLTTLQRELLSLDFLFKGIKAFLDREKRDIEADAAGIVSKVLVQPGTAVEKGAVLVEFAAEQNG